MGSGRPSFSDLGTWILARKNSGPRPKLNAKTKKTLRIARGLEGSEKSKDEGISDHLQAAEKFKEIFCRTIPTSGFLHVLLFMWPEEKSEPL